MHRRPNSKWEEADPSPSRAGRRSGNNKATAGCGEIVEVQGGHIVRSTSKKDRHSKVCTARGPRDRRVRLAAHTAIQFYDVQDRLGYDRPSKAVDWLISKAKSAIDQLAQLPPWHPVAAAPGCAYEGNGKKKVCNSRASSSDLNGQDSNFLPPHLHNSDPLVGPAASAAADVHFHGFQAQDLNLSLQSFQDSIGYDDASNNLTCWLDPNSQRLVQSWNNGNNRSNNVSSVDHLFDSVRNQVFTTQRGPLQSSNSNNNNNTAPSVHVWVDQFATIDHHQGFAVPAACPSSPSVPEMGFAYSGANGYSSGFQLPARIRGDNERGA